MSNRPMAARENVTNMDIGSTTSASNATRPKAPVVCEVDTKKKKNTMGTAKSGTYHVKTNTRFAIYAAAISKPPTKINRDHRFCVSPRSEGQGMVRDTSRLIGVLKVSLGKMDLDIDMKLNVNRRLMSLMADLFVIGMDQIFSPIISGIIFMPEIMDLVLGS